MPNYSYACTECDNRFDAVQAFTDDALTTCPECAGRLRKLFNSVGVVFKGSGFYRNDSRESGKGSASEGADKSSGSDKSVSDKSGSDKSGSDKSPGSDKSGSESSNSGKSSTSEKSSGSGAPSSSGSTAAASSSG